MSSTERHGTRPRSGLAYAAYVVYTSGMEPLSITHFRKQIGPLFTEVTAHHRPLVISRGAADLCVLLGADEAEALVGQNRFSPRVYSGQGQDRVQIWLDEFGVLGEGDSLAEAKEDLLDEVRAYVGEYMAEADLYRRAPNHADRFPNVLRAYIADLRGKLADVIFPGPPTPPDGSSSQITSRPQATA